MLKIKAVELLRKIREDLEKEDAQLSLKERAEKTRKEVEANPIWNIFLKRHQKAIS